MSVARTVRRVLALSGLMILPMSAPAQIYRTYLASDGSDANPCTLTAPCRLLPAALAAVADGGQIWMLDSANFNTATVNVNKSVSIVAVPGSVGSIVTNGGNAISIATPGVKVALRNLVFGPVVGAGGGSGIVMTSGALLKVEDCLFANLSGVAIQVNAPATVMFTGSTIRDNAQDGLHVEGGASAIVSASTITGNGGKGIYVLGSGANTTSLQVNNSSVAFNTSGFTAYSSHASGHILAAISGSHLANNGQWGAIAQSNLGAAVTLDASGNFITQNGGVGLGSYSTGALVTASGNTVSSNLYGFYKNPTGAFESLGNNTVRNNGTATLGTIAPATLQ